MASKSSKGTKVQKVAVVSSVPVPTHADSASDRKREAEWRAEDDARTLLRASEIKNDKKRLAAARAWAKKRVGEMKDIAGIGAD